MNNKNTTFDQKEADEKYTNLVNVLEFVDKNFENGFLKGKNQGVSRVFFEAISVGVFLALKENPNLKGNKLKIQKWIQSKDFKLMTSGKYKTHVPDKILQRVNFVKEKLMNS